MTRWTLIGAAGVLALAAACSGSSSVRVSPAESATSASDGGSAPTSDAGRDASPVFASDAGAPAPPQHGTDGGVAAVFAHGPSDLYRLDPTTRAVSRVGSFSGGCDSVYDLAIDGDGKAYVTTADAFYALDLATAACVLIAKGAYPNSLSFVPKGTLDPSAEALVGFFGSEYVRIDPATGGLSTVGELGGGYVSSGDVVSVTGGGTFLTVYGNECADCLVQIDPKSGAMLQNYGSLNHAGVYGLAFWGGSAYGFDDSGNLFSISASGGALVIKDIAMPGGPPDLSFWGAGSTTAAPAKAPDGSGLPIK